MAQPLAIFHRIKKCSSMQPPDGTPLCFEIVVEDKSELSSTVYKFLVLVGRSCTKHTCICTYITTCMYMQCIYIHLYHGCHILTNQIAPWEVYISHVHLLVGVYLDIHLYTSDATL